MKSLNWRPPDLDSHRTNRTDRLCNAVLWLCAAALGLQILPTLLRSWLSP